MWAPGLVVVLAAMGALRASLWLAVRRGSPVCTSGPPRAGSGAARWPAQPASATSAQATASDAMARAVGNIDNLLIMRRM